jgi:hypothetical protein
MKFTYCDWVHYQQQTSGRVSSVILQMFHCDKLSFSHHSSSASHTENHHPSCPHPVPNGQRHHLDQRLIQQHEFTLPSKKEVTTDNILMKHLVYLSVKSTSVPASHCTMSLCYTVLAAAQLSDHRKELFLYLYLNVHCPCSNDTQLLFDLE